VNFDQAFTKLIGHEGGYSNDKSDPGGETKFGISKRAYPGEDIANMTLERAKAIYSHDYWGPAGCDTVPDSIRFPLFDMAVNLGVRNAIKQLQKTCQTDEDGIFGPITLQAVNSMDQTKLAIRLIANQLEYYTNLATWTVFGKGWSRRVVDNLRGI
jgi:lysozyme family protein